MDYLKLFYGVFGAKYPLASLIAVSFLGALIFGAVWWAIGKEYQRTLPQARATESQPTTQILMKQAETTKPVERETAKPATAQVEPKPSEIEPAALPTAQPLTALSDGQRVVLKLKLSRLSGKKVGIMLTGREPQSEIVYEQLLDIFRDSDWVVSSGRVAFVSVAGENFPDETYMSSRNLSNPTLTQVFSIFLSVGLKVPITPNAFMGRFSGGEILPVVIVVR